MAKIAEFSISGPEFGLRYKNRIVWALGQKSSLKKFAKILVSLLHALECIGDDFQSLDKIIRVIHSFNR